MGDHPPHKNRSGHSSARTLLGNIASPRVAQPAVMSLYEALCRGTCVSAVDAFDRWRNTGLNRRAVFARTPGTDALASAWGLPSDACDPARLVFAVQTYFALLAKLVVWRAFVQAGDPPNAGRLDEGELRAALAALEAGHLALRNVGNLFQRELYAWYLHAWSDPVASVACEAARRLRRSDDNLAATGPACLQGLYESLFPRQFRHAQGEYYTPPWLAHQLLDASGYSNALGDRLLDPSCGAGVFLVEAIRRSLAATDPRSASLQVRCRAILANLVGYDANPLAVLAARASYVTTLAGCLPDAEPVHVPVEVRDSVLDPPGTIEPFDYVVGNPPWIAWDQLPADYREATKPLWQGYGLFSLSGNEGRHGGGKKDLAMLVLYVAADRYLKHGGRLALVVPQTVFQTRGAGDGFRRFRLGAEGAWLGVVEVHDLVDIHPFDAANWTATVVIEKGRPTVYPVPYVKWKRAPGAPFWPSHWSRDAAQRFEAWPVDPRRPTAPWFLWPAAWSDGEGRNPLEALRVGPSDYQAHLGANTGGANGVYWLSLVERAGADTVLVRNLPDQGKHRGPLVEHPVEAGLVYPLLRWGDVSRFRAVPNTYLLLVQDAHTRRGIDEAAMRQHYPNALAYLTRFRELLCRRAAYRRYQGDGPFYAMYNVGPYTLAPCKVVWRRMDRRISAAVVEPTEHPWLGLRPVIPQETCVLVATESSDEAYYLAAQLNSAIIGFLATAHGVRGGKGFGTPGMLEYLGIPRYHPASPEHHELAVLGRRAHAQAAAGSDLSAIEARIDGVVGRLRGLPWRHVARMRDELA